MEVQNRAIINQAFNADERSVEMKLEVYFTDTPLVITGEDYLISMSILEELSGDTTGIYGALVANELSFTLYNETDIFTPANINSPYYGKIETNVKVKVYIREAIQQATWQCIGTYFVTDWKSSQVSKTADVVCHDRLYTLMRGEPMRTKIRYDVPVGVFLAEIFTHMGLTSAEYSIDESLNNAIIPYAYALNGEIVSTLDGLMKAYLFYIYVDREGILCVKDARQFTDPIMTLTDEDQILDCNVQKSLAGSYSSVSVECRTLEPITEATLLSVTQDVPNGGVTVTDSNRDGIIVGVDYVAIESTQDRVTFGSMDYDASNLSITLKNPGTAKSSTSIKVIGSQLAVSLKTEYKQTNSQQLARIGERPLSVQGEYITTSDVAQRLLARVYAFISNTSPYVDLTTRGNPAIQIGDIIQISSAVDNIYLEGLVWSQSFDYNGSLTCRITCIDTNALGEVS